jgi:flagellar hook protein FlgE
MMRSLYTGVSGLTNHQTRMDVLSNNIANVNTIGFKGSRTVFQDSLSQTMQGATAPRDNVGGVNARQIGLGMRVGSIDILFTKTSFQTTNVNTDLAINNNGFFIVNSGAQSYYTRAGNFYFDAEGNFVTNEGLHVMGWMANSSGSIDSSKPIEELKVPVTSTMAPKITGDINFSGNLQADAVLGGATSTSVDIYDAEGVAHRMTTMYTKVGDNQWLAYTSITDAATVPPPALPIGAGPDGISGNVKLVTFDGSGNY